MQIKSLYDSKYAKRKLYWGNKPHGLVVKISKYLPEGSTIIDLGCGEGQDACYLASKGFKVTAVDISEAGINKVKAAAKKSNARIKTILADLRNFLKVKGDYDAIICLNALQFIPSKNIKSVIESIKKKTNRGGYNVMASFISDRLEQEMKIGLKKLYFFKKGELKAYYSGWKIFKHVEKWGKWETHGEPRHRHHVVQLIAQK